MKESEYKSSGSKLRLAYLDGLRGLAALYVVLVHVPLSQEQLPPVWSIFTRSLKYGAFSVVVFIVLSGYCLMLPVARSNASYVSINLLGYFKRRSRRILPPYYAALIICLLLSILILALEKLTGFRWSEYALDELFSPYFSFFDVLSHFLLIHNFSGSTYHAINAPLWTVATEWHLYFIFPLLLLPIWQRFGLLPVIIVAFLAGLAPHYLLNGALDSASPWFLGAFVLGMAAADIGFSQKPHLARIRTSLPWGTLAAIFAVITLITEWKRLGLDIWINQSFCGLASACLLIYCTNFFIDGKKTLPPVLRLLEAPWTVALGTISYSLYLIHAPVVTLVSVFLVSLQLPPSITDAATFLVAIPMSVLAAYLFHLAFERRFISGFMPKRKLKQA